MAKSRKPVDRFEVGDYCDIAARPNPEGLSILPIPSLASILVGAEMKKNAPLTQAEVESIRDKAAVVAAPAHVADAVEHGRGYKDVNPAECWEEYQVLAKGMLSHPEGFLEARERHYRRFFGPLTQEVLHSTDVKPVHIDIYQFMPRKRRPYWTLITGGMSDKRQIEPADCAECISPRAEILMHVAKPKGWMFSVLKGLAEMPFTDNTFLHSGHTVPNGMPMTATPSLLTSYLFLPPYFEPQRFGDLELDGDKVDFLWMVPITEAEREFAVKHGSQALSEKFEEANLSPVVDESRESVV
jgi:hypothetical protein